jgi:hypothetical protein
VAQETGQEEKAALLKEKEGDIETGIPPDISHPISPTSASGVC